MTGWFREDGGKENLLGGDGRMKKPTVNRQKLGTQAASAKTFDDGFSGVASEGLPPVCILDHLPDSAASAAGSPGGTPTAS